MKFTSKSGTTFANQKEAYMDTWAKAVIQILTLILGPAIPLKDVQGHDTQKPSLPSFVHQKFESSDNASRR